MKSQHAPSSSSSTHRNRPKPYSQPPTPPRSLSHDDLRDREYPPSTSAAVPAFDDTLPDPPASLSEILLSFQKFGNGDRALLLAILAAKQAEEERLSIILQTRLTTLQLQAHALLTSTTSPPYSHAALAPSFPTSTTPFAVNVRPPTARATPSPAHHEREHEREHANTLPPILPSPPSTSPKHNLPKISAAAAEERGGSGLEMLLNAVARTA